MLKMTIQDWKKRIDRQFEAGLFDIVNIGDRVTKEITNFEYCLVPEVLLESLMMSPPIEEEVLERKFVTISSYEQYVKYLKTDVNSRRAAFVNNYDGQDNHCISYFHHYVRNNRYCMNVYVRSMNYETNFIYDSQTFNLAYYEIFNELMKDHPEIQKGYIRVFVFSMHVYE
jgi:hypothetical protein